MCVSSCSVAETCSQLFRHTFSSIRLCFIVLTSNRNAICLCASNSFAGSGRKSLKITVIKAFATTQIIYIHLSFVCSAKTLCTEHMLQLKGYNMNVGKSKCESVVLVVCNWLHRVSIDETVSICRLNNGKYGRQIGRVIPYMCITLIHGA